MATISALLLLTFSLSLSGPRSTPDVRVGERVPLSHANIPAFARKYGFSCSVCHAPVPRLNAFGEQFATNGFVVSPEETPRDTVATGDPLLQLMRDVPLAIRFDAYFRALSRREGGEVAYDFETPWVVKLLSGGQVAKKVSYYMYFLLTERGEVAGLEDAYLQFTDIGGSGVSAIVGQFQISDPLFKRELRLEYEDYQPYRVRIGDAVADLTYDRGIMAWRSLWAGADIVGLVVNGQGLSEGNESRSLDRDALKSGALRFSQDIGQLRVGVFGFWGGERIGDITNRTWVFGPDATIPLGSIAELNLQYLRRLDDDPFFGACSIASPCPGGVTSNEETTVDMGFAELLWWPAGPTARFYVSGLFNWIDADRPVVSLRLGEQERDPGLLARYRTGSLGLHWLLSRNVRLMTEGGWNFDRDQARLVTGVITAF
jgi:hypothetical protein